MPKASVRTHKRHIPGVGTVTVQRHNRAQQGGSATDTKGSSLLKARRAGRNLKRAFTAMRRHKKATAAAFLTLGTAELAAWVGLRGLTATVAMVGVLTFAAGLGATRAARAARPEHPGWANGGDR